MPTNDAIVDAEYSRIGYRVHPERRRPRPMGYAQPPAEVRGDVGEASSRNVLSCVIVSGLIGVTNGFCAAMAGEQASSIRPSEPRRFILIFLEAFDGDVDAGTGDGVPVISTMKVIWSERENVHDLFVASLPDQLIE